MYNGEDYAMDQLELYGQVIPTNNPTLMPGRIYCLAMEHLGTLATGLKFYSIYQNYGSIPVARQKAKNDLFAIYLKDSIDCILEFLHSFEIYEYDRTRVISVYKKYATNYLNACEEVYAQYCEIRGDQEGARRSRELAKANRGRFVGGGFGISGAAKGIAMAGAANLATGALYSVGNLLGNAVSKMSADLQCDRLFSSEKTITFLFDALKNDFLLGTDVLEEILVSCNGKSLENPFNNERLSKAKAIMQNIKDNVIPESGQKKALVDVMLNDAPYYDELYLFAYEKFGDDNGNLIRFAEFFGKNNISEKIKKQIEYKKEVEAEDEAERLFLGNNYEIAQKEMGIDGSFADYTRLYIAATIARCLANGYTATIQTLLDKGEISGSLKNDLILFETLHGDEKTNKISSCLEICNAAKELTPGEKVLLYINRSIGSESKRGLLITTKAIYFSPACKCEVPIMRYDKIDGIVRGSFGQSDIIYDKKSVAVFVGLDTDISNLLTLTAIFFKYGDTKITGKIVPTFSQSEIINKRNIDEKEVKTKKLEANANVVGVVLGLGLGIAFWFFVIRKILGLFGI